MFGAIEPVRRWVLGRSARHVTWSRNDPHAELPIGTERKYLEGQVVLVGYGRVGRRIAKALEAAAYLMSSQNRTVNWSSACARAVSLPSGAADPAVLIQAHIADAAMLVIATPDTIGVRQMANTARALNPDIEIMLRTQSEDESALLRNEGIGKIFFSEEELAKGMANHVLERFAPQPVPTHQ